MLEHDSIAMENALQRLLVYLNLVTSVLDGRELLTHLYFTNMNSILLILTKPPNVYVATSTFELNLCLEKQLEKKIPL